MLAGPIIGHYTYSFPFNIQVRNNVNKSFDKVETREETHMHAH